MKYIKAFFYRLCARIKGYKFPLFSEYYDSDCHDCGFIACDKCSEKYDKIDIELRKNL